jgi:hypothetical protein
LAFLASADPIETDRTKLRHTSANWRLCVRPRGSATTRVVGPVLQGALELTLAPDAKTAAVALDGQRHHGIVLIDLASGARRNIATTARPQHLDFSPDGRKIVYSENIRQLAYADLSG